MEKSRHSIPKRSLSAIMFTDNVDYSEMMQKNEASSSERLHRFHKELEKQVVSFNGNIVNYYGDGALLLFHTPAEAMQFSGAPVCCRLYYLTPQCHLGTNR